MISEFRDRLGSRTNRNGRPFQADKISAYAEAAIALDALMTAEDVDGDFTVCDTKMLNRFFAAKPADISAADAGSRPAEVRLRASPTLCGRTRRRLPRPQGDNWGKGDRGTHDAGMETTMVSGDEGRKVEQRMVVEYGVTLNGVWLPLAMLRRLTAHGPWTRRSLRQPRIRSGCSSCTPSRRGTTGPACTGHGPDRLP